MTLRHADLTDASNLEAVGTFQFRNVSYEATFTSRRGLEQCLDMMLSYPEKSYVVRLYLKSRFAQWPGVNPSANLRFDYDIEHQVAAGSLIASDKSGKIHTWETIGDAGRDDVFLTSDSWNADERRFPASAFVPLAAMREAVAEFAFGEVLPPPAVRWRPEPGVGWL